MKHTGLNMGTVKHNNRQAILKCICEKGPISRKDIASETGLTPASVTQITTSLMEEGLLLELGVDEDSKKAGRKKILININYDAEYIFSINIEIEETIIALTNLAGDVVEYATIPTEGTIAPELFIEKIADECTEIQNQNQAIKDRISGIAVGIPGIVDKANGASVHAYGIWNKTVPICSLLENKLGINCIIENNVDAFAKASMIFGEGKAVDNLMVVKWGPGVGSAISIDNKVYEGRQRRAAELGHFIVEKDGLKCSCGRRGCLETKVSFGALNKIVSFSQDDFGQAYIHSSTKQKEMLDEAVDLFARSIVNAITIVAPNKVILSGFLFKDANIRSMFIKRCLEYDPGMTEEQIVYTALCDKEKYIGPVACYFNQLG